MRIACFGGSFNPPHRGHLAIALAALRQARFDEVWFIPAKSAPLRDDAPVAFSVRLGLLEAMIKPYRKLKVCPIEALLPQPSYTINTVSALQESFPNFTFSWIIGSDQAAQFDRWKDADELKKRLAFYVVPRDEQDAIPSWMHRLPVKGISAFSSTRFRQGEVHVAPRSVILETAKSGVYFEPIAKQFISEKRWVHVSGVVSVAVDLALTHGIDPNRAKQAALLHDVTKAWPTEKQLAWIRFCYPDYADQPTAILHQKTAVAFASRILGVRDPQVLHAIGHHVEGAIGYPLTQIIYIADKCEPSRKFDSTELLALSKQDLERGAAAVRTAQLAYLKKEHHGLSD